MPVASTSTSGTAAFDGGNQHYKSGYPHETTYDYDPGFLVLPVASATPQTVKVQTHGGFSVRRVSFNVTRSDNPPIIPKPENLVSFDGTRTDVLVDCQISAPLPIESPTNGGLTWTVRGEYTFVSTVARVPGTDLLPLGGYPYTLGRVDSIASQAYSLTGGNLLAYSISMTPLVARDKHVWPFTVLPPFMFNNLLLKD